MRKLVTRGMVVFAGVMSMPAPSSPPAAQRPPAAEHRRDPRLESLRRFFRKFDCPAVKYSHVFLQAADAYSLDWRLLPSISYVESTGGKAARNNNMFGWDSGKAQFSTPAAGIHTVAYSLSHSDLYRDKSLDEILATYNPNEDYARKVKSVMRRISPSLSAGGERYPMRRTTK